MALILRYTQVVVKNQDQWQCRGPNVPIPTATFGHSLARCKDAPHFRPPRSLPYRRRHRHRWLLSGWRRGYRLTGGRCFAAQWDIDVAAHHRHEPRHAMADGPWMVVLYPSRTVSGRPGIRYPRGRILTRAGYPSPVGAAQGQLPARVYRNMPTYPPPCPPHRPRWRALGPWIAGEMAKKGPRAAVWPLSGNNNPGGFGLL